MSVGIWFVDTIYSWDFGDQCWGSVTFFIHSVYLKPYLESVLINLLPLWSEERKYHLGNLKICPVPFNEMEGSSEI